MQLLDTLAAATALRSRKPAGPQERRQIAAWPTPSYFGEPRRTCVVPRSPSLAHRTDSRLPPTATSAEAFTFPCGRPYRARRESAKMRENAKCKWWTVQGLNL